MSAKSPRHGGTLLSTTSKYPPAGFRGQTHNHHILMIYMWNMLPTIILEPFSVNVVFALLIYIYLGLEIQFLGNGVVGRCVWFVYTCPL